jgi:hypothetical protein
VPLAVSHRTPSDAPIDQWPSGGITPSPATWPVNRMAGACSSEKRTSRPTISTCVALMRAGSWQWSPMAMRCAWAQRMTRVRGDSDSCVSLSSAR